MRTSTRLTRSLVAKALSGQRPWPLSLADGRRAGEDVEPVPDWTVQDLLAEMETERVEFKSSPISLPTGCPRRSFWNRF